MNKKRAKTSTKKIVKKKSVKKKRAKKKGLKKLSAKQERERTHSRYHYKGLFLARDTDEPPSDYDHGEPTVITMRVPAHTRRSPSYWERIRRRMKRKETTP